MRPFYSRSEIERIAMTEQALAERKTIHERWVALAEPEAEGWNARSQLAAEWVSTEPAVLDLGCGTMALERYLSPGTVYYPSDVAARDARTIVVDYNQQPPPQTGATVAMCLGLLEYLYDPAGFLRSLAAAYPRCVASYCTTDAPHPLEPRRGHAWVNDYDRAAIEQVFRQSGWVIDAFRQVDDFQGLWRLGRNPLPPTSPGAAIA